MLSADEFKKRTKKVQEILERDNLDYFSKQFPNNCWEELSMGTSADYQVAIEEGATFIRVGQAILGKRPQ